MAPTRRQQGFLIETVRTDAHPATDIDGHSRGALAEEGARRVDAFAIDAHSRKDLTLVDVWYQQGRGCLTSLPRRLMCDWRDLRDIVADSPSQRFPRTLAKPLLQIGSEKAAHTRPGSRTAMGSVGTQ